MKFLAQTMETVMERKGEKKKKGIRQDPHSSGSAVTDFIRVHLNIHSREKKLEIHSEM